MVDVAVFKSEVKPDWCPGCGDFGVLNSLQKACADLDLNPHEVMVVSGIGCSSNLPGFFNSYGMHTLHGRSLAVAQGTKLANSDMTVIATGGDGDGYGIGVGHFVHAIRRNIDMTYIVMDNQIYGLTTGQTSPTTEKAVKTKSTPGGNLESPLSPLALSIAGGASFVARGFSGDPVHLSELFKKAIQHKGFAHIDVFSPCVTFNKTNTYSYFKQKVYKLEDEKHDPQDLEAAMKKAYEWGERIPIGVLYAKERPTYEDGETAMMNGPLVKQPFTQLDSSILLEFV
jgi:2-oxoglutarate/2-oxoacid ferredoxin oxidoreductase subunit beta